MQIKGWNAVRYRPLQKIWMTKMSEKTMTATILDQAEEDENGDLIYEFELQKRNGVAKSVEVNATHLFQPGERRVGDVAHLVTEAKLAEKGELGGNPAKPANGETAKKAIEQIEQAGLEPAWRAVDRVSFP